ncbi:pentatricopeptide repeat-containing protein At1g62680, mitochondrial-like [Pyrus communis]|uniref:pentatricopeptide repeat-containing protein At1g62680, mitochondrial-like n=1 Tax=Pyrus communis TaxID=23211 RepID=UPI0035C21A9A
MKRITTRPPSPGNLPSFRFTFLQNTSGGFHSDAVHANPTCTDGIKQSHLESESMIQTRCKSGKIRKDEALGYLNSMIQTRHLPSIWTFNCLLGALSKMKQYSTVVSTCKQLMGCAQFQPDVSTMAIFANCLCRLNWGDACFSVLAITVKYGLQPDAHFMASLLHGLCKNSSLAEAMAFFQEIETKGYACDESTYGTKTWEEGRFKPNQACYNPIIASLCKENRINEALALFRDMISKTVVPDIISYTTLIHGLGNMSQWDEVLSLFEKMTDQGVKPNEITYATMINGLCKARKTSKALEILIMMWKDGRLKPD